MRDLRSKPRNEVEGHFDDPGQSPIFQRFPSVINNEELLTFICDYCRLIIIGNARTHEIEALMDEEIQTIKHDKLKAYHSMVTISEAFPALGIVAAVLGVIKAMGALDQAPEVLGHLIGAALVGTFAGIFFSYAVVTPIATKIKIVREKKLRLYVIVKQTLLAFMNGAMPQVALEYGRKTISAYERPSIDEVERETMAGGAQSDAEPGAQGGGVSAMTGASAERPLTGESLQELFAARGGGVERLPLLREVMEKAASACTEEVRTLIGMPLRLASSALAPARAPICCRRKGDRAFAVLDAPGWESKLLVRADRAAVFAIVETMLGSDGSQPPHVPERALTALEVALADFYFGALSRGLATAFAEVAATTFSIDPPMDQTDLEGLVRQHACRDCRISPRCLGGELLVAIPNAALEAMRQPLSQAPAKAEARPDPGWAQQIRKQLTRADVTLTAILEERPGLLGEVLGLAVGQVIELEATPQIARARRMQRRGADLVRPRQVERRLHAARRQLRRPRAGIHGRHPGGLKDMASRRLRRSTNWMKNK